MIYDIFGLLVDIFGLLVLLQIIPNIIIYNIYLVISETIDTNVDNT